MPLFQLSRVFTRLEVWLVGNVSEPTTRLPIMASAAAIVEAMAEPSAPLAMSSLAAINCCASLVNPFPPAGVFRIAHS